ncbi:hypothetical protein SNE25_09520 [Mucilaginibacter sabulilitoris]|uniref:Uncharacterized protein n=1 Tax=Mucilaginibacter sabulilitoris TaxID=1173583 RepID=A0ABZ0TRK3_9SPHI|nr:hypothetical protein [Mucilaginibacter sabulilitoris]WPU95756.1 hypothetical protein SNE25_09520 [Mucilaginibacter sabulilitoris]
MQNPEVLSTPINDLPASTFFKEGSTTMGFETLKEILNTAPKDLLANENFNYVWFGELVDFLTERGILHLLQPTQGNSRV